MDILQFYGGEKWRIDEGAEMSRCIQRLVEKELVQNHQRDSTPDEEPRNALEKAVGMNWREDQGVAGGRGKKLHHVNNQRRLEEHKT